MSVTLDASVVETGKLKLLVKDLHVPSGNLKFADGEVGEGGVPVELVVRTNAAVDTFLGPMVHDLHGMTHKAKAPLDWCHGDDNQEIIGYLDTFKVTNKEITCTGKLVSVKEGDIADCVVKQLKGGIPLESSIYFGGQGLVFEEVGTGASVDVNGGKFNGAGIVVRQWPLRGVALCPYGRDNATSTSLALSEEEIVVNVLKHKEPNMAAENKLSEAEVEAQKKALADKEAKIKLNERLVALAEKEQKAIEEASKQLKSSDGVAGTEFIKAFGDSGAVWFAEGKTYAEAQSLFVAKLQQKIEAADKAMKALETRMKAAFPGGIDGIKFEEGNEEDTKKGTGGAALEKELTPKIGRAAAKFAASIILPGKN